MLDELIVWWSDGTWDYSEDFNWEVYWSHKSDDYQHGTIAQYLQEFGYLPGDLE